MVALICGTGVQAVAPLRDPDSSLEEALKRATILGLGLLVLASPVAHPQTNAPPFTTNGAFFALSVADITASSRWYQEKLGLSVVMAPPKTGEAAVVILEGGGLLVELIQHDVAKPLGSAAPGVRDQLFVHGYFKAGLMVDDFDRTLSALRARGVQVAYGPFPKSATQRANVIIRDNAGNLIQFFGR